MKYYLKRLGHQELGSVKNGKAQRGRYIYISKDKNVLISISVRAGKFIPFTSVLAGTLPTKEKRKMQVFHFYANFLI